MERVVFEVVLTDLNETKEEIVELAVDSDQMNIGENDCAATLISLIKSFNVQIQLADEAPTMSQVSELLYRERIIFHSLISVYRKGFEEVERSLYIAHATRNN